MKSKLGKQIGIIRHGGGINVSAFARAAESRGFIVVFRHGYTTIHEKK